MESPVLLCGKKAVGLDHDQGVGRLHGEDEVVVVVLAAKCKAARKVASQRLVGYNSKIMC